MTFRSLKNEKLLAISGALNIAEEKTGDLYEFSFGQWKRHRYDVKTLPVLRDNDIISHAFALLNKCPRVTRNRE